MQVRTIRAVLLGFIIGPDEQKTTGWDNIEMIIRHLELELISQSIGQIIISQVRGIGAGIENFEPVLEMIVRRVSQGAGIVSHPLISRALNGRPSTRTAAYGRH